MHPRRGAGVSPCEIAMQGLQRSPRDCRAMRSCVPAPVVVGAHARGIDAQALARPQYLDIEIGCAIAQRPAKERHLGDCTKIHDFAHSRQALHHSQGTRKPNPVRCLEHEQRTDAEFVGK